MIANTGKAFSQNPFHGLNLAHNFYSKKMDLPEFWKRVDLQTRFFAVIFFFF
jgi:hypothetical protein